MPRNPNKRPCAYPGCRAWAMRDSDPPYCAAHAPVVLPPLPGGAEAARSVARQRQAGPGAPLGNQNRLFHGFYRRTLDPEEAGDLDECAETDESLHDSLAAEILVARVALRRTLAMLRSGATLGEHRRAIPPHDYMRLIGLAFQGVRSIARLLAVQRQLGDPDDTLSQAINAALDELSEKWDIEL